MEYQEFLFLKNSKENYLIKIKYLGMKKKMKERKMKMIQKKKKINSIVIIKFF